MRRFEEGDDVRIDIPDKSDPDHDRLHGLVGTIVDILEDDAGSETGDPRDSYLFTVELLNGSTESLRWRDLRPAEEFSGE
jgi:ribosomal protein L21E